MRHRANWRTLLVFMLIGFSWGCSLDARSRGPFGPEDPPTIIPKAPLPSPIVAPHVFEFTSDDAIGHIKPKMAGTPLDASVKRSQNSSAILTASEIATLRKAAEADARVAALLGSRWGFIEADRLPPEGKMSFGCCRDSVHFVRLVYYSYSSNVAVDVRMKEASVFSTARLEGYLPPEGPQDVQRGIELARADSRLVGKVQPLEGHGLLMHPDRGFFRNDPGYGHRIIWITFSHGQDGDPKYWAVVDLTEDTVLDAGEEPPRS